MIRDCEPNSCDAMLKVVIGKPSTSIMPCGLIGQGRCFKDIATTEGIFRGIAFGNCAVDTTQGVDSGRKKSPLEKSVQIILKSAFEREQVDPDASRILLPFKASVAAIASTPDQTADVLKREIIASEPKTNRFVSVVIDRVNNRILHLLDAAIGSLDSTHQTEVLKATGGSAVLLPLSMAVEPENVLQYAEMIAASESPTPGKGLYDGVREVRQRVTRDHLGSVVLKDLISEYETPGSKFRNSIFDTPADRLAVLGAIGTGMLYNAYVAVGVAKGITPRPSRR